MWIRDAVLADVPALVAMGEMFRAKSIYAQHFPFDPAQITTTLQTFLGREDTGVFVAVQEGGGLIGAIVLAVSPHLWSREPVATELAWWMDPSARGGGLRLLRVAEAWARAKGAVVLQIGAPMPADPPAYGRLGYGEVEKLYQKDLR